MPLRTALSHDHVEAVRILLERETAQQLLQRVRHHYYENRFCISHDYLQDRDGVRGSVQDERVTDPKSQCIPLHLGWQSARISEDVLAELLSHYPYEQVMTRNRNEEVCSDYLFHDHASE